MLVACSGGKEFRLISGRAATTMMSAAATSTYRLMQGGLELISVKTPHASKGWSLVAFGGLPTFPNRA